MFNFAGRWVVPVHTNSTLGPSQSDLSCMRTLQNATNVIPLLAKADELSADELPLAKEKLLADIEAASVECFFFTALGSIEDTRHINAISSATQCDHETIDASILMRSDYLPPLITTDLDRLVTNTLSVEGSTWLRHSAACKAIKWLRQQKRQGRLSQSALTCRQLSTISGVATLHGTNRPFDRQDWCRIEISSWPQGLRQSLAAERQGLSQQQFTTSLSSAQMLLTRTKRCRPYCKSPEIGPLTATANHQDPLGLLGLVSQLQTGSKVTFELISSLGILGCVAAWVIRPELMHQWNVKFPPCLCLV